MLATFLLGLGESAVQLWMQQAFYPVLLLVLVLASFGLPIPEDVPLIAAGVLIRTHAGIASWEWTLMIAFIGIMSGDVILYYLGQRWGPDVFNHRSVRWLITPARLERTSARFRRYGTWMCFFGRFVMGVRAGMCLTAGVTRFPFWRFLLADSCGALLSIPALVWLGYWGAGWIPTLEAYVNGVKWILLALAVIGFGWLVLYEVRRHRRMHDAPTQPGIRTESASGGFESRFTAEVRERGNAVQSSPAAGTQVNEPPHQPVIPVETEA